MTNRDATRSMKTHDSTRNTSSHESIAMLAAEHCRPGAPRLAAADIDRALRTLPGWTLQDGALSKTFAFADYYATVAFVNAIAWIAHREDHHPDLSVSYNRCGVAWSTHDAGGVTRNDLVCAAKVERLAAA
ncbi:MAG TPA: 4a-hydroxytetrahydrobiopterin dehydratase [Casimicrobiaceae bacterium]